MTEVPRAPDRDVLPDGKLPADDLAAALGRLAVLHPRLLVGPEVGEDAAVIETGGARLVVATDPITFATERVGWYAVHVNANDIAVMGARPAWFFAAVLLPHGTPREAAHALLDDLGQTCRSLGIVLAGGHTEITPAVAHPVIVGQMIGEAAPDEIVTKRGLRPGDLVVLTRGAAIEGTALLARELGPQLATRLDAPVLERARALLFDPGISVLAAARTATSAAAVHAMHDPTEGGVLNGLFELATAARLGLTAWAERIPVLEETRAVCAALEADALALLASGALLVGVPPADAPRLVEALAASGIPAAVVAEARDEREGLTLHRNGRMTKLEAPTRDEVARLLEDAGRDTGHESAG
jgi:hydrogenase maturation factor